ncbi:hypothetical protein ABIA33_002282 [Streptacidiphilus sp. MAP12-16]|uniref:hypothetical protein n=1 Tax=Streptacidiphilus sp. MAP12-16 TaxID=3156300 RepID=UPI003515F863
MTMNEPAQPVGQSAPSRPPHHRGRSLASLLLLVVAWVLAPLCVVAVYAHSEITDTQRYVATMAPLAKNPAIQDAAANRITDLVIQQIDVPSLVNQASQAVAGTRVPPKAAAALNSLLAGPVTSGVTNLVHTVSQKVVTSDAFATVWTAANRAAHTAVDNLLSGKKSTALQAVGNNVVIDLGPAVSQVKQQLVANGVGVASHIPTVNAQFTLLTSPDVHKAQTGYRLLNAIGNWLPLITVLIAAGGVWLAARRRRALVAAALGVAVGMLVLGIGLAAARHIYLTHLPQSVSQPAAAAIFDQLVFFLRHTIRAVGVLGLVVALGAYLGGHGRYAVKLRTWCRTGIAWLREHAGFGLGPVGPWVHRAKRWVLLAVLLVAALILALWNYPTGWVVFWLTVVVLAAVAVVEFLDDAGPPPTPQTGGSILPAP